MIRKEINYEEENEKLILFLQKQSERIKKLRKKCNKKDKPDASCGEKKQLKE
jgi:hypothetical protein